VEVSCSHSKNAALGWDIACSAKAAAGETITRAQILLNGFAKFDESFNPPLNNWQHQIPQQGSYPGENEVRVVITNDKGEDTESLDSWS
jgi:hypothetical protein